MSDETKPETKPEQQTKPIWKSKTIWVAVALAVLPIAEALAQLLPEAIPARYVGLGMALLGAVIAALRWATKLPLTGLVLALVLASSGCAMSHAQRLQLVAEGTHQLHQIAAPAWSGICEGKAKTCVAAGVVKSEDCSPWVTCQANLKRFYEAHLGIQRAIQQAAWLLLNDSTDAAAKVLATAQAGLAAAFELARAEGAIQ